MKFNFSKLGPLFILNLSVLLFARIMEINLKAPWNISQQIAKKMIENGSGGSIVNISSIVSLLLRLLRTIRVQLSLSMV